VANWLFRPDLACRLISIELCMVDGLRCLVIPVKCDVSSKSVKGLRDVGWKMALSYYFG